MTSVKSSAAKPPKVQLTREAIFLAALELIDRDGVEALSMRALGKRLGVFPTAIYWYVPTRSDLVAGAVAIALAKVGSAGKRGVAAGTWQQRLRSLLMRFRAAVRKHPNLAPVIASQLTSNSPLDLPMLDHIVLALEDAGFAGQGMVDAFNVVVAAMCGFPTLELSRPPADNPDEWAIAQRQSLSNLEASDYAALNRHIARLRGNAFILRWTSGDQKPMTTSFEAWVEVIVGGLESRAAALANT